MSHRTESPVPFRAATVALLTFAGFCAGAHAQAEDWQSSIATCAPTSLATLTNGQVVANLGYIRAPFGPNPPLVYLCNVLDSYANAVPTWKSLRLQYNDPNGGAVTAALYSKDKGAGGTVLLATAVSVAAGGVANVQVALPPLNFAANGYFIVVTLVPQPNFRVQGHQVTLAQ